MKNFLAFFLSMIFGVFSVQAAIPSLQDLAARTLVDDRWRKIDFTAPIDEMHPVLQRVSGVEAGGFFCQNLPLPQGGGDNAVTSLCMMSPRCFIAGYDSGLVSVWTKDLESGCWKWASDFGGDHTHEEGVISLTRLDEKTVLSATWNYSVKMWRYDDEAQVWRFIDDIYDGGDQTPLPQFIPFEDNYFLFWYPECDLTEIRFYHYNAAVPEFVFWGDDGFIDLNDAVDEVFIHALAKIDEHHIALGCANGDIKIFSKNDHAHWECVQDIAAHADNVFSLARLDSNTFVSGSYDQSVKIWRKESATNVWQLQECFDGERGHHNSVDDIIVLNQAAFISIDRDGVMKLSLLCPSTRNWLFKDFVHVPGAQKIVTAYKQIGFQSERHFLFGFQKFSFDGYWPSLIPCDFFGRAITSFLVVGSGLIFVGLDNGMIVALNSVYQDYVRTEKVMLWSKLQAVKEAGDCSIHVHPSWMNVYHSLSVFHRCGVAAQALLPGSRKRSYDGDHQCRNSKREKRA